MTTIVLASGSPRRKALLRTLGLDFDILPVDIDETPAEGEPARPLVERLSRIKARAAADRLGDVEALILAADTVVVVDGEVLNKPADAEENRAFLERLQGRTHHVTTGHGLLLGERYEAVVVDTEVTMRALDAVAIARYVASGEGLDKAGAYAVQGKAAWFVEGVEGSYSNVVGLPLSAVVDALAALGVVPGGLQ